MTHTTEKEPIEQVLAKRMTQLAEIEGVLLRGLEKDIQRIRAYFLVVLDGLNRLEQRLTPQKPRK